MTAPPPAVNELNAEWKELDAAFAQVALSKVRLDSIRVRLRDHEAEAHNLEKMAKEEVRKARSHRESLLGLADSLDASLTEKRADLEVFVREQKVELEAMEDRRKVEVRELDEMHRYAKEKMAQVHSCILVLN